jgi:hypothetical protein
MTIAPTAGPAVDNGLYRINLTGGQPNGQVTVDTYFGPASGFNGSNYTSFGNPAPGGGLLDSSGNYTNGGSLPASYNGSSTYSICEQWHATGPSGSLVTVTGGAFCWNVAP